MTDRLLYEDQVARVFLVEDAAADGHVVIQPQRDVRTLAELTEEQSAHLFLVASYTAAILFQGLQAEGTNIISNEEEERLTLHVLARRTDDGLDFSWQPRRLEPSEMADAQERIRDKAFIVGKGSAPKEEPVPGLAAKEELQDAEEKENYLIRQLIKVP